ncbi:MAG: glycosyltransferase, partial [Planctomycetota bacterium]
MRRLKVIIFTAAYGGGHKSVANALRGYFNCRYANKVSVEIIDFMKQFAPVADKSLYYLYKQTIKRVPSAYRFFFDVTDKLFGRSSGKIDLLRSLQVRRLWRKISRPGRKKAREFLAKARPDIIISTYPVPTQVLPDFKKSLNFYIATVITDFGVHSQWINRENDLYFVASDEVKKFLISKGIPAGRVKVTGIPIRPVFSRPVNNINVRKKFGLSSKFTVLVMSGEYGLGKIKKLCEELIHLPVQLVIICGRNERLLKKIAPLARRYRNIKPFGFVEEVNELMKVSDLLVGKAGGITVSEAQASGLPMIIYCPIPGQEMYNVDYLVNHGAAFFSRDEKDVAQKVEFLLRHPERLRQMQVRTKRIGKPLSTGNVCKEIMKYRY